MNLLPRGDVLLKLFKLSLFPLVIALIFAGIKYYLDEESEKSIIGFIGNLAAGFFFMMWLSGQYLRTKKSIDDTTNYSDLQAGINEVKNSINALRNIQTNNIQSNDPSNSLLDGAKQAVESGHVLAGLMQAGVAFEQAIIKKAEKHNIYVNRKTPVAKAISLLRNQMDNSIIGELFALWQLRNQLVHLTPEASEELENRPELIKYFEWGISELEK